MVERQSCSRQRDGCASERVAGRVIAWSMARKTGSAMMKQVVRMDCAVDNEKRLQAVFRCLWVGVTKEKTLVPVDGLARETVQRH